MVAVKLLATATVIDSAPTLNVIMPDRQSANPEKTRTVRDIANFLRLLLLSAILQGSRSGVYRPALSHVA